MTFEPVEPRVAEEVGFRAELRRVALYQPDLAKGRDGVTRVLVDVHVPSGFELAGLLFNDEADEPCHGPRARFWVLSEQYDQRTAGTHQQLLGHLDQIPSRSVPSTVDVLITSLPDEGPRRGRCLRLALVSDAPGGQLRRSDVSSVFSVFGLRIEDPLPKKSSYLSLLAPIGLGTGLGSTLVSASTGLGTTVCAERLCGAKLTEEGERYLHTGAMLPLDLEADFLVASGGAVRLKLGVRAGGRLTWLREARGPKQRFMLAPALVPKLWVPDTLLPVASATGPEPGTSLEFPIGIWHDPAAPSSTSYYWGVGVGFALPVN